MAAFCRHAFNIIVSTSITVLERERVNERTVFVQTSVPSCCIRCGRLLEDHLSHAKRQANVTGSKSDASLQAKMSEKTPQIQKKTNLAICPPELVAAKVLFRKFRILQDTDTSHCDYSAEKRTYEDKVIGMFRENEKTIRDYFHGQPSGISNTRTWSEINTTQNWTDLNCWLDPTGHLTVSNS